MKKQIGLVYLELYTKLKERIDERIFITIKNDILTIHINNGNRGKNIKSKYDYAYVYDLDYMEKENIDDIVDYISEDYFSYLAACGKLFLKRR